jgi:hypothetical protein
VLESLLSMGVNQHPKTPVVAGAATGSDEFPKTDDVIMWLESLGLEKQGDARFKFLLSLYKGRVDLAVRSENRGLHEDARIRSARKELKTANGSFPA